MISERELAVMGAEIVHGRDDPSLGLRRSLVGHFIRWPIFVAGKSREAVAPAREAFHQHPPVPHIGVDQDLSPQKRQPGDGDHDLVAGEERLIAGRESFDHEVLDEETTGEQIRAQATDMDLALDLCRCDLLRPRAHGGTKVDRDSRDEDRRNDGGHHDDHPPGVPGQPSGQSSPRR